VGNKIFKTLTELYKPGCEPKSPASCSINTHHKEPNMAGTSLLALLDDIASVLDDVALMTKVAAKKQPVYWAMIWR